MARKYAAAAVLVLLSSSGLAQPQETAPFSDLLALSTKNYTGGLSQHDREVARRIAMSMSPRYTEKCSPPDPNAGELIALPNDTDKKPLPSLNSVDPNLTTLIRALDNPQQEIRDVSAFTIAQLGPSAVAAKPALEKLFSSPDVRGGWFNVALAAVSCQQVVPPDFRRVIPKEMLPPEKPWKDFLSAAKTFLPQLYLDQRYEYPPGMMSDAFENFAFDDISNAAPLLAQILEEDGLSLRKQIEAAQVLAWKGGVSAAAAQPALERLSNATDPELRFYVGQALVRLRSPKAIPLVIENITYDDWAGHAARDLCGYGPVAIAAEDRLLDVTHNSTWPRAIAEDIGALACIRSKKAEPTLLSFLKGSDWQLSKASAAALGEIGTESNATIETLEFVRQTHWSAVVRKSADDALFKLGQRTAPAKSNGAMTGGAKKTEEVETVVIGGPPQPVNHGLPWCDEKGRYSIDGKSWFMVRWLEPTLERAPNNFHAQILQGMGTQVFLPVSDGWLFGSDGFEDEGFLAHVSRSGEVSELDDRGASIRGIAKAQGHIYAFGFEILKNGDAGSLFELTERDGKWRADRVLTLPSAPWSHAIAPTGELLLSDGPNDYAIVRGRIAPMQCEKKMTGSYFDKR